MAVLFSMALLVPVGFAVIGSSSASASAVPVQPFDQASPSELRSSPKKVFAHYMGTLPVSIDNKTADVDYYTRQYQNPAGEGGIHAAYGGFTRDRPLPVTPKASDFRLRNLETEVRQAIDAGLDGFTLNILALPGTGDPNVASATGLLLQAAQNVDPGFKIVLMPDMDTSTGRQTPQVLASHLASFGSSPAAYRLPDGRLVISPYNAQKQSVAYWTEFLNSMATTYNTPVAFWPLFQDVAAHRDAFAPISYGMSNWGARTPAWNPPTVTYSTGPLGQIKITRDRGLKWMQPVSVQDERPNAGLFWEAENTQNLRNTWQIARDSGAEWVQLTTWNDYTEGSHIAPSADQGYSWLDLQAYYISWFKTGVQPTIVRDGITLTHRTQLAATRPSYPQTKLMVNAGGSPTRDTIEAHSFLTAPATITIKAGTQTTTCTAPAGVSTCIAPLKTGTISAFATRGTTTSAGVTSPQPVTATPYLQDLHYTAATTGRNLSLFVAPTPTPTLTPTPTTTLTPTPTPTATLTPDVVVTPALVAPSVLRRPYLVGAARVGTPVYCRAGQWSNADGLWFTWYRSGVRIPNSNTNTWQASVYDFGKRLQCRVTAWGAGGSSHADTQTALIRPGILSRIKSPAISGSARTGRTLSARVGAWLPVPVLYSFQWYRGSQAIKGATNPKYKVSSRDRGRYITVKVTAKIPGYNHAAVKSGRLRALR